jgi:hypothetical protein
LVRINKYKPRPAANPGRMEDIMIKVTKKQWDKIPSDYKAVNDGGKKMVFAGCIEPGGGTVLLTEGIHFEII